MDPAQDLLRFVAASPSPYHAVEEMAGRLERAGFHRLDERAAWTLHTGDARYVVRDGGSLIALRVGGQPPSDAGVRLIGAHTDSPTLKVRPRADLRRSGYAQIGVEPYGGPLTHTWLDRDLSLAGRVAIDDGDGVATRLVRLDAPLLRIPSLAIHLFRELREQGLKLDPQRHLVPVIGPEDAPELRDLLARHCGFDPAAIVGHDLVTFDTQAPALAGADGRSVHAARLDNLLSCHAAVQALCTSAPTGATQVIVANDHEEVGSATAEGAEGPFLADTLLRVIEVIEGPGREPAVRALARSLLVSADAAHAVHPNYAERHEPAHRPRLGGGPVIKVNANQSYASDAGSIGWFTARARDVGVEPQHFVVRADLPCGSTIGPLTATRLGVQTVDVGNPLLSMHSCREQAAADDVEPMIRVLRAHLETA